MAVLPKLLLCSHAGSPLEPRTWSGTPYKLYSALREQALLEPVGWASQPAERWQPRLRKLDRLLGLQHGFIHGPARRAGAALGATAAAGAAGCSALLHLGTYDLLPLPSQLPHYVYVDSCYDFWERNALAARQLGRYQREAFRLLERQTLRAARRVFTVGEHVAAEMVERYGLNPARVRAVGSGLGDIRPLQTDKDYRSKQLLIVAKLRPADKGLPLLLQALEIARRSDPEISLTVIGGAKYPELQGLAGVRGTGWISAEELQDIFDRAALYVMPAGYEPWGLAYLEALACRTPIVGLNRGAFPELSGQGRYGFALEQQTPEALAALLLAALADPARLARMGSEGQAHCLAHYSWQRVAREIGEGILADLRPSRVG